MAPDPLMAHNRRERAGGLLRLEDSVVGAPTEVTDQPEVVEETEVPESVPAPEIAAPEEPAGPAVEPEPEPQYVTREEFERAQREAREQAERDAAEKLRRDIQRKNALAARERQQEEEARKHAITSARLAMLDQGLGDADPQRFTPAFDEYVKTYRSAYERSVETDATDGFVIAAAKVLGAPLPADLEPTDRAYTYAEGVGNYVQGLYDRAYERAKAELAKEYVPKAEVPKLIDGARKKWLAEQKPSEDFKTPEGVPAQAGDGLTPEQYAAMTPLEQRRLQRERPDLINAMTARLAPVR